MNNTKNVYLMYAIIFLQGFVFYGPVATLFRQARGLSMSQIFIIESISWALIVLLEIPWGWVSDRFGYKRTLVITNVLFLLSKFVFYRAHSFSTFLFERVLLSVVISGLSGCDTALIYESINKSDSQRIFGIYHAFGSAGFLMASVASSAIVNISIDLTAYYTIFPYAIAAVLTFFIDEVQVQPSSNNSIKNSIVSLFSNRKMLLLIVSIAIVSETVHVITVFLNQSQYVRSGIHPKYFGLLVALVQCASMLSIKASKISSRLGNHRALFTFIGSVVVSNFILATTSNPVVSVGCVVLMASSISIINPIVLDIQNAGIESANRATMLSMYSMLSGLIASIGNIGVGIMADKSLQTGLYFCTGLGGLALVLTLIYSYLDTDKTYKIKEFKLEKIIK